MKTQDKETEMIVGSGTPDDEWLEDTIGYKVRKAHLELLGLYDFKDKYVLDAGCGPGTYGIMLAQRGNIVKAVEISPNAVKVANERAVKKGVNFQAQQGDLEKLPFQDNTFDICFCGWVLHHFPDVNNAISELSRVLKPNGVIAIVEPNESNLAVKFSRFVEDLPLLRSWILKNGWDTPNRTINTHSTYMNSLLAHNITCIEFGSCFPGGLPPLPTKTPRGFLKALGLLLVNILARIRRFVFVIGYKLLPKPLNGADLLIKGKKISRN
jgi:ubiquinone/menaquinone biosynthesis C-methylase UbiE